MGFASHNWLFFLLWLHLVMPYDLWILERGVSWRAYFSSDEAKGGRHSQALFILAGVNGN